MWEEAMPAQIVVDQEYLCFVNGVPVYTVKVIGPDGNWWNVKVFEVHEQHGNYKVGEMFSASGVNLGPKLPY